MVRLYSGVGAKSIVFPPFERTFWLNKLMASVVELSFIQVNFDELDDGSAEDGLNLLAIATRSPGLILFKM